MSQSDLLSQRVSPFQIASQSCVFKFITPQTHHAIKSVNCVHSVALSLSLALISLFDSSLQVIASFPSLLHAMSAAVTSPFPLESMELKGLPNRLKLTQAEREGQVTMQKSHPSCGSLDSLPLSVPHKTNDHLSASPKPVLSIVSFILPY